MANMLDNSKDKNLVPAIEALLAARSARSGLKINWLRNASDLRQPVNKNLITLYQEVFAEPPYQEAFSEEDVLSILTEIIRAGGFLFTAQKFDDFDKIIAFVASVPLAERPDVAALTAPYIAPQKQNSYFAEDAVDMSLRRQGISRFMKQALLEANRLAGYDSMILRTSVDSFNQIAAVQQLGAKRLGDLTQEVMSKKADGTIRPDTRCFFRFGLKG